MVMQVSVCAAQARDWRRSLFVAVSTIPPARTVMSAYHSITIVPGIAPQPPKHMNVKVGTEIR